MMNSIIERPHTQLPNSELSSNNLGNAEFANADVLASKHGNIKGQQNKVFTQASTHNDKYQLNKNSEFINGYQELHTRSFPKIKGPVKISSIAFHHNKSELTDKNLHDEIAHITALCTKYNVTAPDDNCRHFYQNFTDFELRWERHNEFSSYTFIVKIDVKKSANASTRVKAKRLQQESRFFCSPAIDKIPKHWLKNIAGTVISAIHIEAHNDQKTLTSVEQIKPFFEQYRLLGSKLQDDRISLWSAMRLHHDNFNRILLLSDNIHECENGRIIRTLLELECYRNLTLLALPLSQNISADLNLIEVQLAQLLSNNKQTEEQQLATLSAMAATVAQFIAASCYRFDAAIAYYQIVQSRFDELQELKTAGLETLHAFVERRLSPALRTIKATKYRLDDLAKRINRASDFLRTKINMVIEKQNQALLTSMNNRALMQFNLQQTVEGVSVIVVTYYLLALTKYVLNAAEERGLIVNTTETTALLLPLYLMVIWLFSLRIKKKMKKDEKVKGER